MKHAATAVVMVCLLPLGAAAATPTAQPLDVLAHWLAGSFDSAEQAAADSAFFDIRLQMVRIWPGRDDGAWFYIEQAAASALDRPYRQRVYRVTQVEPDLFKSAVFALPDPAAAAGQWRQAEPMADLTPADLVLREGCAVFLRWNGRDAFTGDTIGRGCGSELRGASYATSEVEVTADGIVSWDRGFAADDRQVWGAEKGPYVFRRSGAGEGVR